MQASLQRLLRVVRIVTIVAICLVVAGQTASCLSMSHCERKVAEEFCQRVLNDGKSHNLGVDVSGAVREVLEQKGIRTENFPVSEIPNEYLRTDTTVRPFYVRVWFEGRSSSGFYKGKITYLCLGRVFEIGRR